MFFRALDTGYAALAKRSTTMAEECALRNSIGLADLGKAIRFN
jgi:hypothetical protein